MAEIPGGAHSEECATADGNICVCACRGALHGSTQRRGVTPALRRMTEVAVKAGRHPDDVGRDITRATDARVGTPADRRRHPVVVADPAPVNVGPVTRSTSAVPANLDGVSDDDLMAHLVAAAEAGHDSDAQRVWDEIGRREDALAQTQRYRLPKPPAEMTEEELFQAVSDAGGDESILVQLLDELDVRQREQDRLAEEARRPPQEPATPNDIMQAWMSVAGSPIAGMSTADDVTKERADRAMRLAHDLDPSVSGKELYAVVREDDRPAELRLAWYLAWYRKLALAEGVDPANQQQMGPGDSMHGVRQLLQHEAAYKAQQAEKAARLAAAEAADRLAADRAAALDSHTPPPALVRSPTVALWDIEHAANVYSDRAAQGRLLDARRRTLGLPADADLKAVQAAEKADPRAQHERSAQVLAWYRRIGEVNSVAEEGFAWKAGPANDGTPIRPALMPANVSKAWETWQLIKDQAKADRDAGNPGAYERYVMAIRHGLGLPDDAHPGEITRAFGASQGTDNQKAALFIAALRPLAEAAGIDPGDTLRHGPLDKGAGARRSPSHWRQSTPAQDRQLDELLARGWDYIDAYAEVHRLDPEQLRREQGGAVVDRRAGESTDRAVRRQYDEHVTRQYIAAETATRGHLLSRAGLAAGVAPLALFSGPTDRARKYASEDLLRWWEANGGRMTFTQFRAQVLGRDRDKAAAKVTARVGAGKDFG